MRVAIVVIAALFLGGGASPAPAQPGPDLSHVGVLAIAPFADDVALSRQVADYGARRLGELVAGRAYRVVSAGRVADEMRRLDVGPRELISPTKTWMLGRALGADAVLTGRVTLFMEDQDDLGHEGRTFGGGSTRVDVDIRVLDVVRRVNLYQRTFSCQRPRPSHAAMECVVRDVAATLGVRP